MHLRSTMLLCFLMVPMICACQGDTGRPLELNSLIPGPGHENYDMDLEALARMYDRQFHAFSAFGMGLNADIGVPADNIEDRALIRAFLQESEGWDFEAYSGKHPFDVVSGWAATAGLYSGVGIAADAYRYAVLRDSRYDTDERLLAAEHLRAALEGLHIATAITGVPGVIARGFLSADIPGDAAGTELTPLFDEYGSPLPEEKDNGTWRADNSGLYPNHIWLDSCSRDMLIGWAAGFAAAWEVIRDDPLFSDDLKDRLQADAGEIGRSLKVVRESGYDLEIFDADGRATFHGYLNEHNYDRVYVPWFPIRNGMYSIMALGIVAAFQYTAEDAELERYLYEELIEARRLSKVSRGNQMGFDLGVKSNYSGYNMAFMGAWLACRYVDDEVVREDVKAALANLLYDKWWKDRQAKETGQSLFDFIYAACMAGASVYTPMSTLPDAGAMARGLQTLKDFPAPPYWDIELVNCDEDEIASGDCTAVDGTHLDVLGYIGRKGTLVCVQPVPMRIRPPSNYHWRSNPYCPNGGGNGARLLPAVDFRYAYWLGRWTR